MGLCMERTVHGEDDMTTRKRAPRIGRGECRKALALCWRQLSGSTRCDTHHTHPGVGAGALGIAAGTLLSPLLLSAGMNPLVTVASTGLMVMFTSSSTAVQYLILGRLQVTPILSRAHCTLNGPALRAPPTCRAALRVRT